MRAAPGSLTSFLGREEEMVELAGLLEGARLVTLTGAPGIGKSRLAVEVADRLGGGALVELAAVNDPALVPAAVAAALSVPEVTGQAITDTLMARLSVRGALVVLDNCEHLLGACATLVERLLFGCPELSVLATSREPLGLADEQICQLTPLPVPEEQASPQTLGDYAALRLFAQRAGAVTPGFSLNAYVAPAVAEICRRVDGIPLAIELAAARVESLTPEEIARRLDDRFDLLTTGPDVLARHQTLQAALDWSHDLLCPPERALLRRLSVFAGGFDLQAARAVCSDRDAHKEEVTPSGGLEPGEVSGLLGRLVSKSLLVADPGSPPNARYRLLETVRAYAAERLEETNEIPSLRKAHARYYLGLAERAEPKLTGPTQLDWLERLENERANLRSALKWSLSHGHQEWALRQAGALVLYWRVRCHFSEGRQLLDAALTASEKSPVRLRAKALWGAGFMALMTGHGDEAIPLLEEALSLFGEMEDRQGSARALLLLGSCKQSRDAGEAISLLEESSVEAKAAGDSWCLAHALAVAGFCYLSRGELAPARPLFEECLLVARDGGDKQGLRFGLMGLGSVALSQGDFPLGESLLEEAMAVTSELGEDYGKAAALQKLGELAIARGDYARARLLLDEALLLHRETGSAAAIPSVIALCATAAHGEGDQRRARMLFEEALRLAPRASDRSTSALRALASMAAEEGDVGSARRLFEEALELARARGDKANTVEVLDGLGRLARAEGERKRAATLHNEALQLEREVGRPSFLAASLDAIAGLAADAGHYRQAARLLGAANALREKASYTGARPRGTRYDADVAIVRAGLPAQEFDAAFEQGAGLSIDAAAVEAGKGRRWPGVARSGWDGLTETERRVAALAAEGLTNRELAERLFITPATVKNHLSHIFAKLGLSRRSELAREVWRRRQPPFTDNAESPPAKPDGSGET